jgi:hypothetical protein
MAKKIDIPKLKGKDSKTFETLIMWRKYNQLFIFQFKIYVEQCSCFVGSISSPKQTESEETVGWNVYVLKHRSLSQIFQEIVSRAETYVHLILDVSIFICVLTFRGI